jgi:hypothetical protein
MNYRIAKKIVARYQKAMEVTGNKGLIDFHWPGGGGSYSRSQVEKACKIMKISMKDVLNAVKIPATTAPKKVALKKATLKPAAAASVKKVALKKVVAPPDLDRARTTTGTYKGDDPTTPEVNEAWAGGKAPDEYTAKELRTFAKKKEIVGYSKMKKADLIKALF